MNKYKRISAEQARERMCTPGCVILDVRSTKEFAVTRIPGAICVPHDQLRTLAGTMLPDKRELILVYCRSGIRSQDAAYSLISMGYTNVFDFGGILTWPYEIDHAC